LGVPEEAVHAAEDLGWRAGTVRETSQAWLFYSRDGGLVCHVSKAELAGDTPGITVQIDDVPADVIARAFSRGWREGRVEATSWGWIFHSDHAPPVVIGGRLRGGLASLEDIVDTAWEQGFRVEETEHGWYFYPPARIDACCGIARSQAHNPRALHNLVATLRQAGLYVAAPPQGPPDVSRAAP
jgi:hypothetical protein